MTYYEFLWRWIRIKNRYVYACPIVCTWCAFYPSAEYIAEGVRKVNFTNFNQVLCFAQGLRKAGLLK